MVRHDNRCENKENSWTMKDRGEKPFCFQTCGCVDSFCGRDGNQTGLTDGSGPMGDRRRLVTVTYLTSIRSHMCKLCLSTPLFKHSCSDTNVTH